MSYRQQLEIPNEGYCALSKITMDGQTDTASFPSDLRDPFTEEPMHQEADEPMVV